MVLFRLLMVFVFLCGAASSAHAQETILPEHDVISVKDRANPDFEPLGLRIGTFSVYPQIALEQRYDDNIFRTPTMEESDNITAISPGVDVRSNWSRHELRLATRGELGYFADNNDENYQDYDVALNGRLDLGYDTYWSNNLSYQKEHEERSNPDDVGGDEPTEYETLTFRTGFVRELAKLKLYLFGQYRDRDFDNAQRGNLIIDNSGRDREEKTADLKLAYGLSPHYEIFARGELIDVDYDNLTGGVNRSSDGYRVSAGTALNISGKAKGEIYAGYIDRDFGAALPDIGEMNYGGSLVWNISGLTSLKAAVDRELFETTGTGVSGYIRTGGEVSLEHAFRRFLMAEAALGYAEDDFIGSTREDEILRARLEMDYKMGRHVALGLGYRYTDRDSNNGPSNFTNNIIMGTLRLAR